MLAKWFSVIKTPYRAALNLDTLRRWLHVLTNKERAGRGLPPVQELTMLEDVAEYHSANMSSRGFFDHVSPEGQRPSDRVRLLHPELLVAVGENIAMVPADPEPELAQSLLRKWMESPGHCKNILEPSWTHMGLGFHQCGYYLFATQLFGEVYGLVLEWERIRRIPLGRETPLKIRFLGRIPRKDVLVLVKFPDPSAIFWAGNGYYSVGWGELRGVWNGDIWETSFAPKQGRGVYEVTVGQKSNGSVLAKGCVMEVT